MFLIYDGIYNSKYNGIPKENYKNFKVILFINLIHSLLEWNVLEARQYIFILCENFCYHMLKYVL